MITAKDAIAVGRALLGTPYSDLDCINFIKRIIRTAPGGVPGYTVAGTNSLWRSYSASGKYRDLTWTQEGVNGAKAGMLAFKRSGDDVHHVGIVAERPQCGIQRGGDWESQGAGGDYASSPDGHQLTVIHSSSARGCVVETDLDNGQWTLLAKHRYIETEGTRSAGADTMNGGNTVGGLYQAIVCTESTGLNLRDEPGTRGSKIGSLPRGAVVDVLDTAANAGWARVRLGALEGYASMAYLQRIDADTQEAESVEIADGVTDEAIAATTLVREDGDGIVTLIGRWRVAQD